MTVTLAPSFARCQAIDAPMMPAPATTTRRPSAARPSGTSAAAAINCRNRRRFTLATIVSLPLEPVVPIAAPPAQELPGARDKIRRQEERSPGLVLAYVHVFVLARVLERRRIRPEDHVSESHGSKRKAARGMAEP